MVPEERSAFLKIARRETCWLIKDSLAPAAPSGQRGFSFSASQVELTRREDLERELSRFQLDNELIQHLNQVLQSRGGPSELFLVPLERDPGMETLPERIALTERVVHADANTGEISATIPDRSFWSEAGSQRLPFDMGGLPVEWAFLNINHPYHMASVLQVNEGLVVDMESGRGRFAPEDAPSPIVTAGWDLASPRSWDDIRSKLDDIRETIPPGTRLKNQPTPMNKLGIRTGGLSAGSLLVRARCQPEFVHRLLREADARGFSIHSYEETEDFAYLGFKKHPRDEELDRLGPEFDPELEIRRLQQVEWARNDVVGHKGPGGDRRTEVATIDGWTILIERGRARFKDADDILVLLRNPQGELSTVFEEGKPSFETIFEEALWNLHCPESGTGWLDTVYRLWRASEDPRPTIEMAIQNLPPCTFQRQLRYPRGPFLWLLHLLFVEEDINYRFFYHAFRFGPRKRKQGRDMPMNAILRIAASPRNLQLPKRLAHSARKGGGLTARPTEFNGPKHLREWFHTHILAS